MTAAPAPACTARRAKTVTAIRVFVMVVTAILLVRAVTLPRAFVPVVPVVTSPAIAATHDLARGLADVAHTVDPVVSAPDDGAAAEARPVRRTRTVADPLLAMAVLVILAIATSPLSPRRLRCRVELCASTIVVNPSSGRGPPVPSV